MHIQAFFALSGIGLMLAIYSHVSVTAWLYSTGIIYLSQRLYFLSIYTISSYVVCIIAGAAFTIFRSISLYYLFLMAAFLSMLVNFYFGFQMYLDPVSYFVTLTDTWMENINTRKINIIERNLKCCGFHRPREYPKDRCTESFTDACFTVMKDRYTNDMKNGALTYMALGITFGLLIAFVIMHGTQKPRYRSTRRREITVAPL